MLGANGLADVFAVQIDPAVAKREVERAGRGGEARFGIEWNRPAERDQAKVKFNAERDGKVRIHRVDAQDAYDTETRQRIGNNPIYFVIRDDAALITAGPGALKAVKELAVAEPRSGGLFSWLRSLPHAPTANLKSFTNASEPQANQPKSP